MKNLKELKYLWKYIREYKISLIFASILIFLAKMSSVMTGYLNGAAIEHITKNELELTIKCLVIYLVMQLSFSALEAIADYIIVMIETKMSRKMGYFTYKKALALPAVAYEEKSSGEMINRITNDTETIINAFDQIFSVISNLIASIIILVYVFINSWIIGLEIVAFIILYGFIVRYFNPLVKKYHKDRKTENDKFTSFVTESIRGVREIKTLGIKPQLFKNARDLITNLFNMSKKEEKVSTAYSVVSQVLKSFLEVGVFITCALLLYHGKTTLTFFIAMTYYVYRFTWIIENITFISKTYQRVIVAIGRINEILENKLYEDVKFGNQTIEEPKGIIKFNHVTFNYPNEPTILDDFSVEFKSNKKIAIVGPSGQGKSTLFNLITRIFEPVSGSVTLDGIDVKDLTEENLRKNISIIRQEPFIFNRTIKENFTLLNESLSDEEIKKYCHLAYIDEYIESLPNSYDTILGEGGVNLSGGQKQRLSIARTLCKQSKIILFDEATSALDNNSQEYIKTAIDELAKDHTVLIVAHRLSTIKDADTIYVVKSGKVIAHGKHDELMKNCKFYKNLYKTEEI